MEKVMFVLLKDKFYLLASIVTPKFSDTGQNI